MHTLTKHEISSVSGGEFNLYCDPITPEKVPAAPQAVRVPPEIWPIYPYVPLPEWTD